MKVRMLGKAMGEALSRSSSRDRRSEAWGTPSSSFWPFLFYRLCGAGPCQQLGISRKKIRIPQEASYQGTA